MTTKNVRGKAKLPSVSWSYEQLALKNWQFFEMFIATWNDASTEQRIKLLGMIAEFILPKRRPEDSSGDPGESIVGIMTVTDEQLKDFIQVARAPK